MRFATVIPAAVGMLGLVAALVFWRPGPAPSGKSPPTKTVPTGELQANSADKSPEAQKARRIAELQELAYQEDAASLDKILAELKDPVPEIRQAAVEAAVQFGNRAAIPKLQEAALQATNREEKLRLLEAADFLKLPSLTEVLNRTNHSSSGAK